MAVDGDQVKADEVHNALKALTEAMLRAEKYGLTVRLLYRGSDPADYNPTRMGNFALDIRREYKASGR